MIQDLLLRWVVTGLFVISALECAVAIAASRRSWVHVTSHSLHFVMAVAMAVMAWPRGAALPTTEPMIFFLAASAWFVVITFAHQAHRAASAYHAAMMLAMAWMYAAMSGSLQPQPAQGVDSSLGGGGHHGAQSMPGMDMPGMDGSHASAPVPPFVHGLNWLCTVAFTVAAIWWLYLYFAKRRNDSTTPARHYFGVACQAMMAAGMAIMFGVML